MKVLNIHERIIAQPKMAVAELLTTLATDEDKVWPKEQWPRMHFKDGLREGAHGGHGPIRYFVKQIIPDELVVFQFTSPKAFIGTHHFEIKELNSQQCLLKHVIDMKVSGIGILSWSLGIRWLHDAFAEDALDKVESHFAATPKRTPWNAWVKLLRWILG